MPLAAALGVLIFLGSFIPIIGLTVTGTFAVAVAMLEHGVTAGIVVAVAIVVLIQLEAHLLQPLIMSRSVEVHPLAIALSVLTGTILAGIPGALLAVPLVAFLNATTHALRATPALPSGDGGFPVAERQIRSVRRSTRSTRIDADDADGAADPKRTCSSHERRPADPDGRALAPHVDRDLVALADTGGRVDQRQRDALLQRRRERPAGDLADRHAGLAEHGHVRARDAAFERLESPQQPGRAVLPLGAQRVASPERVLLPADRPRSTAPAPA